MQLRPKTPIDQIAENWVNELVIHDPTIGTYIGRNSANESLPDYSFEKVQDLAQTMATTLTKIKNTESADLVDAITKLDLTAELELAIKQVEAGEHLRDLNVISSPLQDVRDIFELMPQNLESDWEIIAKRMLGVEAALASYQVTLSEGIRVGKTPALRQVKENVGQANRIAKNFFENFISTAIKGDNPVKKSLQKELFKSAKSAQQAYQDLANFLETTLAPQARKEDAFGRQRYELAAESFLGLKVDLDETYEWGIAELAKLAHEQEETAAEILGMTKQTASNTPRIVELAIKKLDADESKKLYGTQELQQWMQQVSDIAVAELGETQFDIPAEIRTLECMIAPNNEGGIYYTGPSDDFSRPGRMWWSVPEGVTEFNTWRELTTVYHEGVPGHHLQIGQAVVNRKELNEWRRQLAGTSGHAEGWALYAERLMEELGYLEDPANKMGMLDGQRMRAARVVLDIGMHLGKQIPGQKRIWDADYALEFMRQNVNMNDSFLQFEVNRYLGWAGQAPSYKIGQRIWEELRTEAANKAGKAFDVRKFHKDALGIGGVRLDTLQRVLRKENL